VAGSREKAGLQPRQVRKGRLQPRDAIVTSLAQRGQARCQSSRPPHSVPLLRLLSGNYFLMLHTSPIMRPGMHMLELHNYWS